MPTDIRTILDPLLVDRKTKADAWDAFHAAQTPEEFKARFDALALPKATKASLWDAKFAEGAATAIPPPENPEVSVRVTSGDTVIPPPEQDGQAGRSLGGFARNVGSSAVRMGSDIAQAVVHPIDTINAVGGLGLGLVEKAIPDAVKAEAPGAFGHEKNVDALVNLYVDRYGGLENLKKTLYEDPIGVLSDFATVAGAAGLAAKGVGLAAKAGNFGRVADNAERVLKVVAKAGELADPVRAVGKGTNLLLRKTSIPERLYESALKPSLGKRNLPRIGSEIDTALTEGIPVSAAGVEKIGTAIEDLNGAIKDEIATAGLQGQTISPTKVASRISDVRKRFALQVNPEADLAAIDKAKIEFMDKYAIKDLQGNIVGFRKIPVEEAQAVKIGTYRQLKDSSFGQLSTASKEAQKALARGIKEELAAAIPELSDLNARESRLLQLQPVLDQAVARIRNHQLFGIGTPIAAAGAEAVTGSPKIALAAAAMRAVLEQPQVKSRLAIALNSLRERNPAKYGRPSLAAATSRVQGYIDSLGDSSHGAAVELTGTQP